MVIIRPSPSSEMGKWTEGQGPLEPHTRGRGQRPPPGLGLEPKCHMAERTAVQGWARGRVRRAPFPGGRDVEREVPYRRSQEGPPSSGVRVGHWARAGYSKKDLRQAQGLRAKADSAQRG